MVGIQGLVNGWVRVNKTHMNIPQQGDGSGGVNSSRHGSGGYSIGGSVSSNSIGGERSGTSESTSAVPSASVPQHNSNSARSLGKLKDTETEAIRRQHHGRRKNRKLQRTVSHTDLLREMAKEKEVEQRKVKQEEADRQELSEGLAIIDAELAASMSAETTGAGFGSALTGDPGNAETDTSLRRVAGFFGTDLIDPQQQYQPHQLPLSQQSPASLRPVNTGKFLNEAAFVQQYESTLTHNNNIQGGDHPPPATAHHHRSHSMETSSIQSSNMHHSKEEEANLLAPMRNTPPLPKDARSQQSSNQNTNPMQQWFGGLVQPKPHKCHNCEEYESRLMAANADLDYLRSVALRNEYICAECRNARSGAGGSLDIGGGSMHTLKPQQGTDTLAMLSKRIQDLTFEQRIDVEEVSIRESNWHQESNVQLSAQVDSSKQWREEAEVQKQLALSLRKRLNEVQTERDELRTETTRLTRRVHLFEEKEMKELKELRDLMVQYEISGLVQAQTALVERDSTIADLSKRLDQTLATLDLERRQQQQRRQIILPTGNNSSGGSSELRQAREAAAKATAELERYRVEMERKEQLWMKRLQEVEQQQLDQHMNKWS